MRNKFAAQAPDFQKKAGEKVNRSQGNQKTEERKERQKKKDQCDLRWEEH